MRTGALALVVGPSGAGKDTLIGGAREVLASDPRYFFPRRAVTRAAVAALEDHDTVTPEEFEKQRRRGAYALDWEAHGLRYGLPASVDAAIVAGRIVVANVSRQVIARAVEKYDRCFVLLVTAAADVRAARLVGRGRESAPDVAARLEREDPGIPVGLMPIMIDNSGPLDAGVRRFVAALREIAK